MRTLEILVAAVLLALLAAWLDPKLHPPVPSRAISVEAIAEAQPELANYLFVDARPAAAFAEAHIPGAVSLNEDDWGSGLENFLTVWDPELNVVVYCDSSACQASEHVAERLREELAMENVRVLEGGWESWRQAGLPVE